MTTSMMLQDQIPDLGAATEAEAAEIAGAGVGAEAEETLKHTLLWIKPPLTHPNSMLGNLV